MIIVTAYPPNIEKIVKVFPNVKEHRGVVFTLGQVIYNPDNEHLDEPLQFHEATHSIQQDKLGAEKWWDKYLEDKDFRLSQEVEAYQNQYKKYRKTQKDRNKIAKYLHRLASDLSGEVYGKIVTYSEAKKLIA